MSEVDFDLLADYAGGALAGTPDEERVASLVAGDPFWAAEHRALVAALAATADDLAVFAEATAEPMPDEVVARLSTVLPVPAQAVPAQAAAGSIGPARDDRVPGARRPPDGRPPARPGATGRRARARWLTWAAPALVAVIVATFAGLWISQSARPNATVAESAGGGSADSAAAPEASAVPQITSGRDYDSAAVAAGIPQGTQFFAGPETKEPMRTSAGGTDAAGKAASPELGRLRMAAELAVCVDAIEKAHGLGKITVSAADFASYEGRPAVIVFFTDSAGARWGWAVGPDCGPGGTDELFRSRVG